MQDTYWYVTCYNYTESQVTQTQIYDKIYGISVMENSSKYTYDIQGHKSRNKIIQFLKYANSHIFTTYCYIYDKTL